MTRKKTNQDRFNARRRKLEKQLMNRFGGKCIVFIGPGEEPQAKGRVIAYKSELDYIGRCILDYPDIETGGQLFGYWTEFGTPVVLYAIGPGPRANHQTTFFNQDLDYLVTVGRLLKERYGLHHIGEWHSHHRLGLARPSGHDARTMNSTIREKGLRRFLLCIGNLNGNEPEVGAFICDGDGCYESGFESIAPESPLRPLIDRELAGVLVHPHTPVKREESPVARGVLPDYALGSWLYEKENRAILNEISKYVKVHCGIPGAEVRILLDDRGEVLIRVCRGDLVCQEIYFQRGFPRVAPRIRLLRNNGLKTYPDYYWNTDDGIFNAFCRFYNTLV